MIQIPGIDYSKAKLFNYSFDLLSPVIDATVLQWIGFDINLIQNVYFQPLYLNINTVWLDSNSNPYVNNSWQAQLNIDFFAKRFVSNNYIDSVTQGTGTYTSNKNYLKYFLNNYIPSIIVPIEGVVYEAPPKIEFTGYCDSQPAVYLNLFAHFEITGYIWPLSS